MEVLSFKEFKEKKAEGRFERSAEIFSDHLRLVLFHTLFWEKGQ